jgi:fatty-acyl-CoA synthase
LAVETLLPWLHAAGVKPDGGLRFIARDESASWVGWGEIRQRAVAVAGGLQRLGVRKGDRVALVYPTCPEFFSTFFGALLCGAVPVPLYPPVRLGRLPEYLHRTARMVERSGARLVLAAPQVRRVLGEAIALANPALGCKTIDDLPLAPFTPVEVRSDDLALVQFSSGTTVDPKPVALTHRALVAQIASLSAFFKDTDGFRHTGVSWLPLYHDMGLIGCIFPALARDATMTLIGPELFVTRPAIWLRTLSRYQGSISPAPSFAYSLAVTRITDAELEGVDLSSWQTALNGAESVAPGVVRAFCERFAPYGFRPEAMTPVYGLSEAALAVTFSDLAKPLHSERFERDALAKEGLAKVDESGREIVSVGRPLPGFRVRIEDPEGRELPEGRIGRVVVSGPSLMEGYLGDPEATARVLCDGWLDTGDLGFCHEGELYLTGRAKDLIILRGRNHAPEEIERAVEGVIGVRAGCVVAVSWLPEGAESEEVVLLVETAKSVRPAIREALPEACRQAVVAKAGIAVDRVVPLAPGTLPRTSSGKLRRSESLRLYLAGELTPPDPVTPLRLAGAMTRSTLAFARLRMGRARKAKST